MNDKDRKAWVNEDWRRYLAHGLFPTEVNTGMHGESLALFRKIWRGEVDEAMQLEAERHFACNLQRGDRVKCVQEMMGFEMPHTDSVKVVHKVEVMDEDSVKVIFTDGDFVECDQCEEVPFA